MTIFIAIINPNCSMSYKRSNSESGIIGEFNQISENEIIYKGTNREEIELKIKAHYFSNPNALIYLCDESGLIYEIFYQDNWAKTETKLEDTKWHFGCFGMLVLLATICSIITIDSMTSSTHMQVIVAMPFVIGLIYLIAVKLGFFNPVMLGVILVIFTILFYECYPIVILKANKNAARDATHP